MKLTGQQFSSSHTLEVYRGSLSQQVCLTYDTDFSFNFLSFNFFISLFTFIIIIIFSFNVKIRSRSTDMTL